MAWAGARSGLVLLHAGSGLGTAPLIQHIQRKGASSARPVAQVLASCERSASRMLLPPRAGVTIQTIGRWLGKRL